MERLRDSLPGQMSSWHRFNRAEYLEAKTLLPSYLLSAQGDRMLMGSSIEGRFPFLDRDVMALAARLPDSYKLRGLDELHGVGDDR